MPGIVADEYPEVRKDSNMVAETEKLTEQFPPGTPVVVTQTVTTFDRNRAVTHSQTIGTVEDWEFLPTGSWYAHGKNDRLWLTRLKLRKVDGEITLLVIDDLTSIARLEAAKN